MVMIYADGADYNNILDLYSNKMISGFTTNPTLMRQAGITNYELFAKKVLNIIKDKPISFEVFADEFDEMYRQALKISSWGENVNVKIPITNTKGHSSENLIKNLSNLNIKCNVTAIFTIEQIEKILLLINKSSDIILSIFAGRIADTGVNPIPLMIEAIEKTKNFPNVKILWASTREALNIIQAEEIGCHIITVTPDIIKKISNFKKDLGEFSLETVEMFFNDAKKSGYSIN
jgi:transaldolase|tara:strand:+ start:985 stop:1683 length:699 start_codon:yes stop_codon:yes gene_type:complete